MARPEITGKKPHATAHATGEAPPIRGLAMSIREFCAAHRISEDMFYKMRREKWGPTVMRVGTRTLISIEAAAEWRKAREQSACACGEFKGSKTPPEGARREPPPGGMEFCDERR